MNSPKWPKAQILYVSLAVATAVALAILLTAQIVGTSNSGTAAHIESPRSATTILVPPKMPAVNSWILSTEPGLSNNTGSDNLMGVSCASASFCVAAGYVLKSINTDYLLIWNGTKWILDTSSSLDAVGSRSNYLAAISCPTTIFCAATGGFNYGISTGQNAVLIWNGRVWTDDTSPALSSARSQNNFSSGISCISSSFCMLSGGYTDSAGAVQDLFAKWDGTKWTTFDSPSLSTAPDQYNDLISVSCAAANFCVAIGTYYDGSTRNSGSHPLLLTWNGVDWTRGQLVGAGQGSGLNWVSCTSTSFCIIAGGFFNGSGGQSAVWTWNGTSWKVDADPASMLTQSNGFNSVSCISPLYCVAIGNYRAGGQIGQNYLTTWDGSMWSLSDNSALSTSQTQYNLFNSVSCVRSPIPSGFCVAVGNYYTSDTPSGSARDLVVTGP